MARRLRPEEYRRLLDRIRAIKGATGIKIDERRVLEEAIAREEGLDPLGSRLQEQFEIDRRLTRYQITQSTPLQIYLAEKRRKAAARIHKQVTGRSLYQTEKMLEAQERGVSALLGGLSGIEAAIKGDWTRLAEQLAKLDIPKFQADVKTSVTEAVKTLTDLYKASSPMTPEEAEKKASETVLAGNALYAALTFLTILLELGSWGQIDMT